MARKQGLAIFKVLRFTKNGITVDFDDYIQKAEEGGGWWTAVCADCREKYASIFGYRLDRGAARNGTCFVKGCWNEVESYIDFEPDDVIEVMDNAPVSYEEAVVLADEDAMDEDKLNAILNNALWIKAAREQNAYRDALLKKRPMEILQYAFEYAMREDILCWLENNDLDTDDAAVLLTQEDVLSGILVCFENLASEHMTEIGTAIENHAYEVKANGECGTKDDKVIFEQAIDTAQKIVAEESEEDV